MFRKKKRLFWFIIGVAKIVMNYNLSEQTIYAIRVYIIHVHVVYMSGQHTSHRGWINRYSKYIQRNDDNRKVQSFTHTLRKFE